MDHRIHVKEGHSRQLVDFLQEYSSLARAHPNQAAVSGIFPPLVQRCFDYANSSDEAMLDELWVRFVRDYQRGGVQLDQDRNQTPIAVCEFTRQCARLAIPRLPFYIPPPTPAVVDNGEKTKVTRVSPKKMHEVSTMSAYIDATFPRRIFKHGEQSFGILHEERASGTLQEGQCGHKRYRRSYIVDVGAGQGYLSRALMAYGFHVLALDADEKQTKGSVGRTDWLDSPAPTKSKPNAQNTSLDTTKTNSGSKNDDEEDGDEESKGSVSHRTVFVDDADALNDTINNWIKELHRQPDPSLQYASSCGCEEQAPIVVVGLHACGDLTPAILKFIRRQIISAPSTSLFSLVGCVVVGCCYNMMSPSSFPLSEKLSCDLSKLKVARADDSTGSEEIQNFRLDAQHLHLAAQAPKTWSLDTPPASERANLPFAITSSTALSMRKITYRALLARRLPTAYRAEAQFKSKGAMGRGIDGGEEWPPNLDDVDWRTQRIGRLATSVYKDFPTFLNAARTKLSLPPNAGDLPTSSAPTHGEGDMVSDLCAYEGDLAQKIQVFQVLRCFLGPLVESLLVLDRYWFLVEAVHSSSTKQQRDELPEEDEDVQLINLFDQSTGSLRNTALVWKP